MSRRHSAEKREVNPDPKFGNIIITKFMNSIMYDGKKSAAESIVYGALAMIEAKTKQGPLPVFEQALENVMPTIEVRSRRVGGATYQVPVEVRTVRRQALGLRRVISAGRRRNQKKQTQSPWGGGGAHGAPAAARHPLDHLGGTRAQREDHDRTSVGGVARRVEQPGERRQ